MNGLRQQTIFVVDSSLNYFLDILIKKKMLGLYNVNDKTVKTVKDFLNI